MNIRARAKIHAALGDEARLLICDELGLGDLTVGELRDVSGLPGNLLAHHLDVLEGCGLIERRRSEGDHRRRYVVLRSAALDHLMIPARRDFRSPLFVCTHNSARSQFAAALWHQRTGEPPSSAGTHPASRVHPKAVTVAADLGVDLAGAVPSGYGEITGAPDVVISVCDRARETESPFPDLPEVHWSVPDPVFAETVRAFRAAFEEIVDRVERLVGEYPSWS